MTTQSSSPYSSPHVVLLQKLLQNPTSLFEHRIFTTLTLLMRNLTEQFHDYSSYYSRTSETNGFFNSSVVHLLVDETEDHQHHLHHDQSQAQELATLFWLMPLITRILLTLLCGITATYALNRRVLRNKSVQFAIEVVVCHLIILPFLPFIALFFAGIGVARAFIYAFIVVTRKRWHLVRPEDGFWAYEEHANSSCSVCVYMIQGKCDLKRIADKVSVVVASPVVQGKMLRRMRDFCGFAVWEDVDRWDVNEHIRVANPRFKKGSWSDKDVLDYFTTFQDIPLNSARPAWEVIVVPNLKLEEYPGQPCYACVFRMHHALMDGISSANILHQVLGDKPFKFTIDPVTDGKRHGKLVTALMYFCALLVLPRTGLMNGLLCLDNWHNKWFSPGEMLRGPKHFTWSRAFRMEALKKIKDRSKSSVMTVLLSGLGGSYRKMEEGRRRLAKKKSRGKKSSSLPEFYHALAPVALLPYPDRHPRNGFSGCALPVAVGQYANTLERLQSNHKEFKRLNIGTLDILGNFLLISMVGLMPTQLQLLFQRSVHLKMSLSNIPGSDEQICIFGGDRIVEMGAWLPCKFSLGMAMGLFSYGGRCRATMVGDQTYLSKSDVESLVNNFETEITNLGKRLGMSESDIFY